MPNKRLTIDFETRSEADLKALGAWAYAEHSSTEIMCMSYSYKEGENVGISIPKKFYKMVEVIGSESGNSHIPELDYYITLEEFKKFIVEINIIIYEAHNAEFERALWHHILHKRYGWPDIPIHRWRCSAAKAAAHALPRALGRAAPALGVSEVKDKAGHRLMMQMCKPRKPKKAEKIAWLKENYSHMKDVKVSEFPTFSLDEAEKNMPTLWKEDRDSLIKLFKYCIQDVKTEVALSNALRSLSLKEQKVWELDQKINQRGIKVDIEGAQAAVDIIEEQQSALRDEFSSLVNYEVEAPTCIAAFQNWLSRKGLELPNLQKETIEQNLEKAYLIDPALKRVLEIRQSLGKTSTSKFTSMINTSEDGRARSLCMYHGASTGRWSGKRIQPHNLMRSKFKDVSACIELIKANDVEGVKFFYGDPIIILASCVRGMLVPEEGKEFLCGDFKSIEAGVLGWLADEKKVLDAFRDGLDIYKVAAMDIYNTGYDLITIDQRRIGKVAVLALGYQGGVVAFQQMAPNYGVYIEDELADDIKTKWRAAHPNIVQFWWDTESTVKRVIKTGKDVKCGKTAWGIRKGFLHCKLPSGRLLSYYKPCLRLKETPWGEMKETISFMGMNSMTNQWGIQYTYGGKLVENITQAVARDLLAEAMVRVEEAGYPIVLHVHDEILVEVEKGTRDLKEFEDLMAVKPHWAEGCPVSAEGWRGNRYKK